MCDFIVAAVPNPDTDCTRKDMATVVNDVVVDGDLAGPLSLVRGDAGFADPDPAGTQIMNQAPFQPAIAATLAKPDPVSGHVADLAVPEDNSPRSIDLNRRFDRGSRLRRLEPSWG